MLGKTPTAVMNEEGRGAYRLVIKPRQEAMEAMLKAALDYGRQQFGDCFHALEEVELVVAAFHIRQEMEPTLMRWLHRVISQQEQFPIRCNNYGSKREDSLYIRFMDHGPIRKLAEQLRPVEAFLRTDGQARVDLVVHPTLVIASGMGGELARSVLMDFASRHFDGGFEVEALELEKREPGKDSKQLVARFPLLPAGYRKDNNLEMYLP